MIDEIGSLHLASVLIVCHRCVVCKFTQLGSEDDISDGVYPYIFSSLIFQSYLREVSMGMDDDIKFNTCGIRRKEILHIDARIEISICQAAVYTGYYCASHAIGIGVVVFFFCASFDSGIGIRSYPRQ